MAHLNTILLKAALKSLSLISCSGMQMLSSADSSSISLVPGLLRLSEIYKLHMLQSELQLTNFTFLVVT